MGKLKNIILPAGQGRKYRCGAMTAIFKWIEAAKGTFLRIPAKTMHDFKNQTDQKTGILNFYIPGGFERNMPAIVKWFEDKK